MRNHLYKIVHYRADKYHYALDWRVYAKDDHEAQDIAEHLRQCCIKNGGFTPAETRIKRL